MRVLVPYVRLSPHTKTALESEGHQPIYVYTPGPLGYMDALAQAWSTGHGFCVVEQDKVPFPGALKALWDCPDKWCVYPCRMWQTSSPAEFPTLSTVKFSDAMVSQHPEFMRSVRGISVGNAPAGHYSRLDMAIYDMAARLRIAPHWHDPEVLHMHEEESC